MNLIPPKKYHSFWDSFQQGKAKEEDSAMH